MPLKNKIAVIGTEIRVPIEGNGRSLEEAQYDVVQALLAGAGMTADDIDGIVVGSNDQMDGRAISVMMASGPVGGVDRDILSTPSAGEHAFVMGGLRVHSGLHRTQLVMAWSPLEAHSIDEVERLGADPYFHRRLPLAEVPSFALQASALGAKFQGADDIARALAGESGKRSGARPPWPLTPEMVAPPVYGIVALIIASQDFVDERKIPDPAWVHGLGWATEPYFLGDRDLASAPALEAAARQAYDGAGLTAARDAFQVAEICDPTPYQALLILEGLGILPRDQWNEKALSLLGGAARDIRINPSGGPRAANAVFCNGLTRIAEAARQVSGHSGANQVDGINNAIAHAASGFAMQYQTVAVLGRNRQGVRQ